MASEMNRIASNVENMVQENAVITQNLEENLKIKSKKKHHKKRKHHKKKAVYTRRENAHNSHVPSDANDKVISFINSQNLGWTADICKLQKHHKDYSKEECESGEDALLMT